MVEYTGPDNKAELIAQLARARGQFAASYEALRRDADIAAHLKHSFAAHKSAWIGSAGIAGWLLSRIPARKKKVIVQKGREKEIKEIAGAGLALTILKMLFTLLRPVIMAFASRKIADIAKKNERWQK